MLEKEPEKGFNNLTFCTSHCTLAHTFDVFGCCGCCGIVLSLLFLGSTFLVALLAYIDRNHKRK